MKMTLEDLIILLRDAKFPRDVFGDGDLHERFRQLSMVCHPDRNPGNPLAEAVFKQLKDAYEKAQKPPPILKLKKHSYEMGNLLATGDAADVHHASCKGRDYVLKASRVVGGDAILENESKAVSEILKTAKDAHYRKFFPLLVESAPVHDKIPKRVNAFAFQPGLASLEKLHQKIPVLEGRHLGWIFRRILTALGFAHQAGWVHGSVLPSHVLVHAEDHGIVLVGWGQSVKVGETVKVISSTYRHWHPPEILNKRPAVPSTDVYMAAECMVHLGGSAVPHAMNNFFQACLLKGSSMRPGDAWKLHDEFGDLLRKLYGPPKYVPLNCE